MRTASTSLALAIGLAFLVSGCGPSPVQEKPKPIQVMQAYCGCKCGTTSVNVTPLTQPPNQANCQAISGYACQNSGESESKKLSCDGQVTFARPVVEMDSPLVSSGPIRTQ